VGLSNAPVRQSVGDELRLVRRRREGRAHGADVRVAADGDVGRVTAARLPARAAVARRDARVFCPGSLDPSSNGQLPRWHRIRHWNTHRWSRDDRARRAALSTADLNEASGSFSGPPAATPRRVPSDSPNNSDEGRTRRVAQQRSDRWKL
jgi:hypothetical protein